MKEIAEGIKVSFVGAVGFATQLTSVDMALKIIVGLLTAVYVGGKTIKMFRDWNKEDE